MTNNITHPYNWAFRCGNNLNTMELFEPFDDELKICSSGKRIQLKSKIPIPCCWIKICDTIGKIVFKKIEKDLTELEISLIVAGGIYEVTIVSENRFTTKTVLLK